MGDVNLANCSVISHYGSWPLRFWNFLTERMSIDQYGCLAGLYTFFRPYHLMHTALIWEFCHIVFQQNCAQDHTNSKLFSTTLKFQKKKFNNCQWGYPFCRLCNTVKLWTMKAKGLVKFFHYNKEVLLYWRSFPYIVLFLALHYFWGEKYNLFILHWVLCYIEVRSTLQSCTCWKLGHTHTKCCFEIITVLNNSTSKERTRHCWSKIWQNKLIWWWVSAQFFLQWLKLCMYCSLHW